MLEQRRDQRSVLMMTLIIVVAVLAFFVIWTIISQISLTPAVQTTIRAAPVVESVDVVETANYIKYNHQSTGLAPNWQAYQVSLNYADYSSNVQLQSPVSKLVMDTPLVSLTSGVEYNLPLQHEYVADTPLVSYTSGVEYNLPAQQEFIMEVPLVSLTADVERTLPVDAVNIPLESLTTRRYSLPLQNRYVMDVPLVSLTAGGVVRTLPVEQELTTGIPLEKLTTRRYSLPFQNQYVMDMPLVALTAGIESKLSE